MKKLSVAILSLLLLTAYSASLQAEALKVGAILPLSGTVAPWGERVRIGLATANELLGNRFSIVFEDEGACEGRKALSSYRKLRSVDKVSIIFVGCLSGTEAIAPIAAKESVLLLSLGLLNDSTLGAGAKLVNLATEISTEVKYLTQYIQTENPERMAGVFFTDAFGQEFSRVMSRDFAARGKPFVALDDAAAEILSFRSMVTRWKQLQIDLLVTTLGDRQQVILLRELKELALKPKIFSSYILECYAPTAADRALYEGIKYTHPVNSAEHDRKKLEIESVLATREAPGQSSNINALFAYDGLKFLLDALSSCAADDSACLFKYFTTLGKQRGVSGEMTFQASGALARPYGLKTVKNGEFIWLDRRS